jgi:hypothetical protein
LAVTRKQTTLPSIGTESSCEFEPKLYGFDHSQSLLVSTVMPTPPPESPPEKTVPAQDVTGNDSRMPQQAAATPVYRQPADARGQNLTESAWAFWAGIIGSASGVAGAILTLAIFHLGGQLADRQKTFDLAAGMAPFLFDDAAPKQKFALDVIRSFWAENADGAQASVAELVVSAPVSEQPDVQQSMRSLVCTSPAIFTSIFHQSGDVTLTRVMARLIGDIENNPGCQGKFDKAIVQEAQAYLAAQANSPATAAAGSVPPPDDAVVPTDLRHDATTGQGFSVYVASERNRTDAIEAFYTVKGRLAKSSPALTVYLMRPARSPCWWGITVGFDLNHNDAVARRDQVRAAGYKDAYVTNSIGQDAARAACPK